MRTLQGSSSICTTVVLQGAGVTVWRRFSRLQGPVRCTFALTNGGIVMSSRAVSTALLVTCAALTTGIVGCSKPSSNAVATKERYNVTVRWTAHGVPHVRAQDWGSLGYGFAYAVATDA